MIPVWQMKQFGISTEEAYALMSKIESEEGLIVSPSAAANIAGAIRVASSLKTGTVVTILPDNGDKV